MYNGVKIAEVSDGTLKITARKIGGKVQSVRMNTKESWTYGYFEARLKLPKGKGTWPAFWTDLFGGRIKPRTDCWAVICGW